MLRRFILALVFLPCLAAMAEAGAWSRGKGNTFIANSSQIEGPDTYGFYHPNISLYGERGLTKRLTAGVDLGGDGVRMSKAIVFLRWPLVPGERPVKLAFEIGAGQIKETNALRPGLSLGRGLSLWDRSGWLALDTRAIVIGAGKAALESDFTFGLSNTRRTKLILQLQTGRPAAGDTYARLVPSFVYEIKPGQHIELGVSKMFTGDRRHGLKIGLWRRF